MTKNNLRVHLGWLLDQGPSLYPSVKPPAGGSDDRQVSRQSVLHEAGQASTSTGLVTDGLLGILADIGDSVEECGSDAIPHEVANNSVMARLSLAPQSASKPRMLFQNDQSLLGTPKVAQNSSSDSATISSRGSRRRRGAEGTVHPTGHCNTYTYIERTDNYGTGIRRRLCFVWL